MSTRRGVTEQAAIAAIDSGTRGLRLPTIRDRFEEIAAAAEREQLSYLGFLAELVMAECDDRDKRRGARRIHDAGFPRDKRLELSGVDLERVTVSRARDVVDASATCVCGLRLGCDCFESASPVAVIAGSVASCPTSRSTSCTRSEAADRPTDHSGAGAARATTKTATSTNQPELTVTQSRCQRPASGPPMRVTNRSDATPSAPLATRSQPGHGATPVTDLAERNNHHREDGERVVEGGGPPVRRDDPVLSRVDRDPATGRPARTAHAGRPPQGDRPARPGRGVQPGCTPATLPEARCQSRCRPVRERRSQRCRSGRPRNRGRRAPRCSRPAGSSPAPAGHRPRAPPRRARHPRGPTRQPYEPSDRQSLAPIMASQQAARTA